jgi:glycosyltransferase involved in cell wall biosynthesis
MQSARIAHVVSSLQVGGAERIVLDLAIAQQQEGRSVTILSLGKDNDALVPEARSAGIPVASVGEFGVRAYRLWAAYRWLQPRALGALHVHSPWCLPLLAGLAPLVSGSIIYTRHGAQAYDSRYWRMLHLWFHRYVDHLTFVSGEALEVHKRVYRELKIPHHLLEFGVKVGDQSARRKPSGDPIRLGCVGRLVELKGHRYILDAVAKLGPTVAESVEIHIFGDGPLRESLEDHASRYVPAPVIFHGCVVDREKIYSYIDLLVVGSRTEGLSMAIMEAMARGIPAVATDVGGNSRLVIPEVTGLLVPYADVEALAQALRSLVTAPGLLSKLGAGAFQRAKRHFALEQGAQRVIQLYGLNQDGAGHD